jgi:hypothetical protein
MAMIEEKLKELGESEFGSDDESEKGKGSGRENSKRRG